MLEDPFNYEPQTRLHWMLVACLFVISIFAAAVSTCAYADPAYQTKTGDVTLTLHTEKCELAEITNLPRRATWTEGGKTYEGCWGARPDQGIILAYFTDKTVASVPIEAFVRVTGA